MRLTHSQFESAVEEAIRELPPEFAELLENVSIVVEEEPSDEDYDVLEDDEDELLGIYRGVSRTERSFDMLPSLPDQIAIFRGPILRLARTRQEAVAAIRDTVVHELGHYFGLEDGEMDY